MKETAYLISRNPKFNGYQRALAGMVYKFFDKKIGSGAIATSKAGVSVNEQLSEELHKPVTEKFKTTKVYTRLKDNIWSADLPETVSLSFKNRNVKKLLCLTDFFTKHAWVKPLKLIFFTKHAGVKPLKDKKGKTILNAFIEIVNEFNRKP